MIWLEILALVVVALALVAVVFYATLPWILRYLIRLILLPRYGFAIKGKQNIPRRGPVVLVPNHVTWIDGVFLAAACPRHGHVLANAAVFRSHPLMKILASRAGMIPVPFSGPKAQRAAITAMRQALERGALVVIFPEGQLTRNGMLGPFYRGIELILKGYDDVAVVPVALTNLWGSIWSFQGGKSFGKRPEGLRRVVHVAFGKPLTGAPSLFQIRVAMQETLVEAEELRRRPAARLETIDPSLPSLEHPELGLLAASAADFDLDGITQPGQRAGSVGLPPPGVALRVVDAAGLLVGPDVEGSLEARVAGRPGWNPTGWSGRIDRDGFVTVV